MTKKILLYGINFSPELTGIGKYTGEMAAWLAARGHQVRVVTAPPYYPDWKVGAGFKNGYTVIASEARQSTKSGSLVVYRCPLWVPPQPGGIKRLLHLASFALTSLPVMLRQIIWRPDVVWVVEPALFCAPAAVVVARLSGARAWLHVQDFEVDAAFDLGLLRGKWLRGLVTGAERWLMRRFDVVSTISKRMHQRLLDKGVAPGRALMAVNWVDLAGFKAEGRGDPGGSGYRAELGIAPDAVVALYSGNMGGKQGLELLAEVAKVIAARAPLPQNTPVGGPPSGRLVFVFCGNGAGRADLVQRCQGLGNVQFLDLQPAARLPDLLAMADIHLLPQRADAADLVMPSKLTGMLASARPVVATAHPGTELAHVVQACGVVVPPEDPQAFADALLLLAADPDLRQRLGAAGFLYAQAHLDKEAVLARFEADLQGLFGR
ncbi:MAG: glycosyltransferase WbuB [Rhodoferax sp.]|uniref:glycosyltransferase WbuB n=1 Tax=Rhodoferax sp. TaxID=50421 RepID=UPI003BB4CD26